jgi:DUF4097 and DUF4098 domain-containing protein YvlB
MNRTSHHLSFRPFVALTLGLLLSLPAGAGAAARRPVDEHRAADAQGQVEIVVVSGGVNVVGWEKAELAVTGTIGENVEKLEITTAGKRTTVRVVQKESHVTHWDWGGNSGDAEIVVHVPRASSLTATLVSADLKVADVQGNQELQSVSGDLHVAASREVRIGTVSGDVHLTAGNESKLIEVGTVSGDVEISGGGGDVTVNTVSGDGVVSVGSVGRLRTKSVSGDFRVTAGLTAEGRFEAEAVSGDIEITFAGGVPPAEFDVQSFSGDLTTCFGQKPVREHYGPGSRLSYKEGAGTARVKVDTKSGDVSICSKH